MFGFCGQEYRGETGLYEEDADQRAGADYTDDTYDMVLDFVVEGSLAVLRYRAQNDMKKSPQEIAGLIDKISNGGISVFESCTDQ